MSNQASIRSSGDIGSNGPSSHSVDKDERAIELGNYIVQTQCTVRDAAKKFEIGKSTVHKDVTERLFHLDKTLSERVRKILDYNLSVRHLRGGEATKNKCAKKQRRD